MQVDYLQILISHRTPGVYLSIRTLRTELEEKQGHAVFIFTIADKDIIKLYRRVANLSGSFPIVPFFAFKDKSFRLQIVYSS